MTSKKKQTRRRDPVSSAEVQKQTKRSASVSRADLAKTLAEMVEALAKTEALLHQAEDARQDEVQKGDRLADRLTDARKVFDETRRTHSLVMQELKNELEKANKTIAAFQAKERDNAEMQARIEAWQQQRRDDHGVHSEASRQNVNLRAEKARMHLSIVEVIADLEQFKDQRVAMATAVLRGLVE